MLEWVGYAALRMREEGFGSGTRRWLDSRRYPGSLLILWVCVTAWVNAIEMTFAPILLAVAFVLWL